MKKPIRLFTLLFSAFLPIACMVDKEAKTDIIDGEGSMLSQEVDDMGNTSQLAAALLKTSAESISVATDPPKYDTTCECYIRTVTIQTSSGYSRERKDSVYFRDAAGNSLKYPRLRFTKTIHHVRQIVQSKSGREATVHIVSDRTVSVSGTDTIGVWTGSISGSFAGKDYKSGTITTITRKMKDKKWLFPESGSLEIARDNITISITYTGDGKATVVRTNTTTGKSQTVTLDASYSESI